MTEAKPPQNCADMADLRLQIDRIDAALIDLLVQRASYIDRAIDIKKAANLPARITSRVDEVIENVRRIAADNDLDPDLAQALWAQLIEWSIQREAVQIPE
jgi:isochorismate pyruvate lyase